MRGTDRESLVAYSKKKIDDSEVNGVMQWLHIYGMPLRLRRDVTNESLSKRYYAYLLNFIFFYSKTAKRAYNAK